MNAQLVKIDVAAASLGWSAAKLFDLVDGGTLLEKGFAWVFNLANDPTGDRRDLRFWFPEVQARANADTSGHGKFSNYEIDWVIAKVLPEKRQHFQAGEVDQLFQIRPRTRIDLHVELNGNLWNGAHTYRRDNLAAFLRRRWLGAVCDRKTESGKQKVEIKNLTPASGLPATTPQNRAKSKLTASAVAGGAATLATK